MKLVLTFLLGALMLSPAMAKTQMAKDVLSQSTTNTFCTAGYDGPNPYEKTTYQRPDPAKSICEGQDVIECYRKNWNKQNN